MSTARTLRNFTTAADEAAMRYEDRQRALKQAKGLLRPDEVAGEYDTARLLQTTLGGQLRPITHDDLRVFKAAADQLGKRFKGGVTVKQIIDRSLPVDRQRANEQIRTAVIRQAGGGKIHFVTNASKESDVSRHHVLVDFVDYLSGVASPAKTTDAAKLVMDGKIRCACDCGRWTFWYSYLATIGKFNAGAPQQNFPKIRNPHLVGVACKHVLRVMQVLSMPPVKMSLATMIEQGRRGEASKVRAVTRKDAQELARLQAKQADHKRSQIETTSERRTRLAQQRQVKAVVEKTKLSMKQATPAKVALAMRQFEKNARLLAQMGMISQKMLADMLAKAHGKKK